MAVDSSGNIYFADAGNHRVGKIDPAGNITTIASGSFTSVEDVVLDPTQRYLYISDSDRNEVFRLDLSSLVLTPYAGDFQAVQYTSSGPATSIDLDSPGGLAVDSSGNLYIANAWGIRKVDVNTGLMTTVAGDPNLAGSHSGDGGPAMSAGLDGPSGVAVDSQGNLYITEATYAHSTVRKVDASTGIITTIAGTGPAGYNGDNIPATSAQLSLPLGVVVDSSGNVYVADYAGNRIRKIDATTGTISTIAGDGSYEYNGDNIPATSAEVAKPYFITLDNAGNVYFGDLANNRVREITFVSLTQSTVTASPTIITQGNTTTITLAAIDTSGQQETSGGQTVTFALGAGSAGGTFGPVTDNGNGTYTVTFTGTTLGTDTFTATFDGDTVLSASPTVTVVPAPVLTSLGFSSVPEGSGDTTLPVNGNYFGANSIVEWNGTPLATTYISSTQLQATIPASLVAEQTSTNAAITVVNPAGNGSSNALPFAVTDANNLTPLFLLVASPTEGQAFSGNVAAFNDSYFNANVGDFTATIDWGDNTGITAGTVNSPTPGTLVVSSAAGHTYAEGGIYSVTVILSEISPGTATSTLTSPLTVIDADRTAVNASASPTTAAYGQPVTLSATVESLVDPDPATGVVTFIDGTTPLGTASWDGIHPATLTVARLDAGTHTITAVYDGEGDYLTSQASFTLTVTPAGTTTTLRSSGASIFGKPVTLTAAVSAAPGAGTADGTVLFEDLSTGTPEILQAVALDGTGHAQFTTTDLVAGTHPIEAVYEGDGGPDFASSNSNNVSQTVSQASTKTTVKTSQSSSDTGQLVTFTAKVTVKTGAGTPSGTVTFLDGTTSIGTATVDATGTATLAFDGLDAGIHSITAFYNGDGNFSTSTSSAITQTVRSITATAVTANVMPSVFGQFVTLTATISPNVTMSANVSGSVTFYDGGTVLGTATVAANGTASFGTAKLALGGNAITATYSGDGEYMGSTGANSETVNQDTITTTLTSSLANAVVGQSITLTANVSANAPGSGKPTGVVTFYDGATLLGTGTITNGSAKLVVSGGLAFGSHTLTASYAGDVDFVGSVSTATTQTVLQAQSATALKSSSGTAVFGQTITLTATVTVMAPGSGKPSGVVTFVDGATAIGTANLNANGVATFQVSTLTVGSHTLTVSYGGDTNFIASNSTALTQTVNPAQTKVTASSNHATSVWGQPVTLTATVTASSPGAGTPTGTVTFQEGPTVLGTATLNASGVATLPPIASLSVGTHSITLTYQTDGNFATSSAALSQVVKQAATTSVVTASPSPSVVGQSVTITATVSPVAPGAGVPTTPTGTVVTFYDGATLIGSGTLVNGVATLSVVFTTKGKHNLKVVYAGDGNFTGSTSAVFVQTVN